MKKFETLEEENEYLKKCIRNLARYKLNATLTSMKSRCYNKNNRQYKDYGARGIKVCDEWRTKGGLDLFIEWAFENGWDPFLTIDRIDVNGNYEPDNCRWTTHVRQNNNKQNNHFLVLNGERHTISEWAKINNVNVDLYYNRVRLGWSDEDILTRKKNSKKKMPH